MGTKCRTRIWKYQDFKKTFQHLRKEKITKKVIVHKKLNNLFVLHLLDSYLNS